jgi:hypothetical protein
MISYTVLVDFGKAGLVDQFTASKMWGALNKLHQKGGGGGLRNRLWWREDFRK